MFINDRYVANGHTTMILCLTLPWLAFVQLQDEFVLQMGTRVEAVEAAYKKIMVAAELLSGSEVKVVDL